MRARTACWNRAPRAATRPSSGGSTASIFWRISRARTGEAPPVETPMVMPSRVMMAGVTKLHNSGRSTTFTGMPRAVQAA